MGFVEMGICADRVDNLKPSTKFVLIMLADRAERATVVNGEKVPRLDGKAECWPSIKELAKRTCQSQRTIIRQIRELENLGLIEVHARSQYGYDGRRRQATNLYVLNLPDMLAGVYLDQGNHEGDKLAPSKTPTKTPGQAQGDKMSLSKSKTVKTGYEGDKTPPYETDTGVTPYKDQRTINPSLPPSLPDNPPQGREITTSSEGQGGKEKQNSQSKPRQARPAKADSPANDATDTTRADGGDGQVSQPKDAHTPTPADWKLIHTCLPAPMRDIPPTEVPNIAGELRTRLNAGWTAKAIQRTLNARSLPTQIHYLPGFRANPGSATKLVLSVLECESGTSSIVGYR